MQCNSIYPGSLAWDVDISLVRRVFLVKSEPTSAHTHLNSVLRGGGGKWVRVRSTIIFAALLRGGRERKKKNDAK